MAKRVFMTGANGFIGQHILHNFLDAGHSVRAAVRSQSKVDQLSKTFSQPVAAKQLEFAIVPDIAAPGAFDTALKSTPPFDTVVHTASPFNYRANLSPAEFYDPAIKGTTEILGAVVRVAPSVTRVVLTSSMAAVINWGAPKVTHPAKVYSGDDWFPISRDDAMNTTNVNTIYQSSKKFAELAAWEIANSGERDGHKVNFTLATFNPPMVYGPVYDAAATAAAPPQSMGQSVWNIYNNFLAPHNSSDSPVPPTGLHLWVDVRDVARAHLLAATTPEAGGKRFVLASGSGISNQEIANVLRAALPQLKDRIPKGSPEDAALPEGTFRADPSLAERVLGMKFRKVEETIGDLGRQLAGFDKTWSS